MLGDAGRGDSARAEPGAARLARQGLADSVCIPVPGIAAAMPADESATAPTPSSSGTALRFNSSARCSTSVNTSVIPASEAWSACRRCKAASQSARLYAPPRGTATGRLAGAAPPALRRRRRADRGERRGHLRGGRGRGGTASAGTTAAAGRGGSHIGRSAAAAAPTGSPPLGIGWIGTGGVTGR